MILHTQAHAHAASLVPTPPTHHQGTFHASRDSSSEGYVSVRGHDRPVLVVGNRMNRAVDRDVVVVRLLDRREWARPSGAVESDDAGTVAPGGDGDDTTTAQASATGGVQATGAVVGIVRRSWRP